MTGGGPEPDGRLVSAGGVHRPELSGEPGRDQVTLQGLLDSAEPGTLILPAGTLHLTDGLVVPAGWTLRGESGGTWLTSADTGLRPLIHVTGSDVTLTGLGLRPPSGDPGPHGGDLGTGITVGRYLYGRQPDWISRVRIDGVRIHCDGGRTANAVALMGAVRDITLHDVEVHGGHTGVAVHWGAVGADVSDLTGPTFHPHRLRITGLRVRDAVEGFYLSSVSDVVVAGAHLHEVDMGFRLLPGDNTDRFHRDPQVAVGRSIDVRDVCVRWAGDRYAVRIAGWGRSEIDGAVTVLRYADTVVRDCVLRRTAGGPAGSWAPVVVECADGVALSNIRLEVGPA